jgi:hypothetical protein
MHRIVGLASVLASVITSAACQRGSAISEGGGASGGETSETSTGTGGGGGSIACGTGYGICGQSCVDHQFDPKHCGECDKACAAGQVCSLGKCGLVCLGGSTMCGSKCVDPMHDPAHCGKCDSKCLDGQACVGGFCTGTICVPATSEICYSGPAGTLGVGVCKYGLKYCNKDGTGYGPCDGQVLPAAADDCFNALDDDCNGKINDGCVFKDCLEVIAKKNDAPSGTYPIKPGAKELSLHCDNTTDKGGWTLVFSQKDENIWNTAGLYNYGWSDPGIATLIAGSKEIMSYFADASNTKAAAGFDKFKFAKPKDFETLWTNANTPDVYAFSQATNLTNNTKETVTGSKYSTNNFGSKLSDADVAGSYYGRFGLNSPKNTGFFFAGWAAYKSGLTSTVTQCAFNNEAYNAFTCKDTRYLVIWAR